MLPPTTRSIFSTGGALLLDLGTTVANAGGTVTVDSGGLLTLNGASIDGGTLSISGTLDATGTSTISDADITVTNTGLIEASFGILTIDPALLVSLANFGTLEANGGELDITTEPVTNSGTMQAIGGGTLKLTTMTVTNTGGTVAVGGGSIMDLEGASISGGVLTNSGTIETTSGTSTIGGTGSFTNSGTLEAVNASTLQLIATAVTDAASGVTMAGAGSHIDLQDATLLQHTVSTAVGGVIDTVSGSSNTINTANGADLSGRVHNAGTLAVNDDSALTLISAAYIDNTGTIELNSTGDNTTLYIDQGFAGFDGGGHVTLSDDTHNIIAATASGQQLTNLNNTISGAGDIGRGGLVLVNNGVIDANGQNTLKLDPLSLTNTGTLEATSGGVLLISDTTVTNYFNLVNGTIAAIGTNPSGPSHSSVGLQNATIDGGTISITAQGAIVATGGINTISGAASITNSAGTLEANGAELDLVNSTVTNTSSVIDGHTVNGIVYVTGASATIKLESATISGGQVTTAGAGDIIEATSGLNFINDAVISNAGLIEANGGTLTIDPSTVTNTGTLEAAANSALILSSTTVDNAHGIVKIDAGGTLTLDASSITGGTIDDGMVVGGPTAATGLINVTGSSTIDGGAHLNNGYVTIASGVILTLDNDTVTGTTFTDTASGAVIQIDDDTTLTLSGVTINGGTINDGTGSGSIAVTGDSTISDASLNNGGVTLASGVILTLDNDTVTGTTFTDTASGAVIQIDDDTTLTLSGVTIDGGTINDGTADGSGSIAVTGASTISNASLNNGGVTIDDGVIADAGQRHGDRHDVHRHRRQRHHPDRRQHHADAGRRHHRWRHHQRLQHRAFGQHHCRRHRRHRRQHDQERQPEQRQCRRSRAARR